MISVDELWLKGGNRKIYFKAARDHVMRLAKSFHDQKIYHKNLNQQLFLEMEGDFCSEFLNRLRFVPGLNAITPVVKVERSIEKLEEEVLAAFEKMAVFPKTFKVECKRIDKTFQMNSMDLNRHLGGVILRAYDQKIKVDVRAPECLVKVKIYPHEIYLSATKITGTGGLPVGKSGHLITLLSGGFDSPVASYMMAKRGCKQTFIFFYAYPFVGEEVKEKIIDLFKIIGRYHINPHLYIVPIGNLQKVISKDCREEYRTLFFRRAMIEMSCLLGDRLKADGVCTGDSLGQVSSQTIGAITLMDETSPKTIFRPLVGMNKQEIVKVSMAIEAHDISVKPHDDACSLFAAKHPVIKPDKRYWNYFWEESKIGEQLGECLDAAEVYQLHFNGDLTEK